MIAETETARVSAFVRLCRFAAIGSIGFTLNLVIVTLSQGILGVYVAGVVGFIAAASATWWGNRLWTFADARRVPVHRQWALALSANFAGFVVYYSTFVAVLAVLPLSNVYPVLAIVPGAAIGMGVNFIMARRLVFR